MSGTDIPTKPADETRQKVVSLVTKQAPLVSAVAASEDAALMKRIARWHIHRHRASAARAKANLGIWFGENKKIVEAKTSAAAADEDAMERLQGEIVTYLPETFRGARAVLRMAMTILAEAEIDRHSRLADGPVLALVSAACRKLEYDED